MIETKFVPYSLKDYLIPG